MMEDGYIPFAIFHLTFYLLSHALFPDLDGIRKTDVMDL
jgi:hypothetical protein